MNVSKDGGHAFPTLFIGPEHGSGYPGMSLRDWFAGQATEQDITNFRQFQIDRGFWGLSFENPKRTREQARYAYADAMLAAREETAKGATQ